MERFEARLEVDNREAAADNSLMSCSVAHMERFVDNILAGNKANNRFPDAGVAADHNSHMDLGDMLDNAFDAWVESNRVVEEEVHNDMVVSVLNHHLFMINKLTKVIVRERKEQEENKMNERFINDNTSTHDTH